MDALSGLLLFEDVLVFALFPIDLLGTLQTEVDFTHLAGLRGVQDVEAVLADQVFVEVVSLEPNLLETGH